MQSFKGRKQHNNRGVVLVITAIMLPIMLLFLSMVLDFGFLYVVRGKLQDVADAAALAGASQISTESQEGEKGAVAERVLKSIKANDSEFKAMSDIADDRYLEKYKVPQYSEDGDNSGIDGIIDDKWLNANYLSSLFSKSGAKSENDFLVEYCISGPIVKRDSDETEEEAKKNRQRYFADPQYVDRVRVRITKKVPLIILDAFLPDCLDGGVLVTVKAAAGGIQTPGDIVSIKSSYLSYSSGKVMISDSVTEEEMHINSSYQINMSPSV